MNTIPADRGMVGNYEGTGTLSWDDVQLRAPLRPVRRPTPPPAMSFPARTAGHKTTTLNKPSLWIDLQSHSLPEHWFLALLTMAAIVAIVYGFSCMTDLVQNWAAVNAGVNTLIH